MWLWLRLCGEIVHSFSQLAWLLTFVHFVAFIFGHHLSLIVSISCSYMTKLSFLMNMCVHIDFRSTIYVRRSIIVYNSFWIVTGMQIDLPLNFCQFSPHILALLSQLNWLNPLLANKLLYFDTFFSCILWGQLDHLIRNAVKTIQTLIKTHCVRSHDWHSLNCINHPFCSPDPSIDCR